jgi:hypothetical protein
MTILSNANAITPAVDDEMYGLRFNDPTKHLTWTPTSAGNRRTWTFSCWTKLGAMPAGSRALFGALGGDLFYIVSSDLLGFMQNTEAASNFRSSLVVRDPSAWYHLMLRVDTTDATSYRRVRFYMNGFEVTLGTASYPSQNYQGAINNNVRHLIGINETYHDGTGLGGYLSEVTFVDGLSLDPSYFSEEDADWGHRKPKAYDGVFGANGFYLNMKQDTTNDHFNTVLYTGDGSIQNVSGVGFAPDLIWVKRRDNQAAYHISDTLRGNTKSLSSDTTGAETTSLSDKDNTGFTSDGFKPGPNYWVSINTSNATHVAWCWKAGGPLFTDSSDSEHLINHAGDTHHSTTQKKFGATGIKFDGTSDWLSIKQPDNFNFGTGDVTFETWVRISNPTTGAMIFQSPDITNANSGSPDGFQLYVVNATPKFYWDTKTHSNTWIQIQSTTTVVADTWYHVALVVQSGTGKMYINGSLEASASMASTPINFGGLGSYLEGFNLGVRLNRGNVIPTYPYYLNGYMDEIRISNIARYTANFTPTTTAFVSDDNTKLLIHSDNDLLNTDGTINSVVSANPDQGFSIVSYTGNGSGSATFGHGLSSAPEMVIVKTRSTNAWAVYHTSIGNTHLLELNTTGGKASNSSFWNNTTPTSSVFTIGSHGEVNASGQNFISYVWHSVAGYSKIGSYTGNGSTTGPTITTDFKVGWLLVKRTDATDEWRIFDIKRDSDNTFHTRLEVANPYGEGSSGTWFNVTNTTFQAITSDGGVNASGGNYIYMAFADTTAMREATDDKSGQGNSWIPNGFNHWDQVLDSPNNNFATFNPLYQSQTGNPAFSEGNLQVVTPVSGSGNSISTMGVTSGKYYAEFNIVASSNSTQRPCVGITGDANGTIRANTNIGSLTSSLDVAYMGNDGDKFIGNTESTYGSAFVNGDIIGVALNVDDNQVTFYHNGTSKGAISFATGGSYHICCGDVSAGTGATIFANFGQDATFGGNKSPSAVYSDGKYGSFFYQPPTDFKALCTQNLSDPAVKPDEHFNAVTYTGNGSTQSITGVGFQPDFTWFKTRSATGNHALMDSVRGIGYRLKSDLDQPETALNPANVITSFDSDGISVGSSGSSNSNSVTYVAWNWKAGGTAVSNTSGTITSQVSANVDAGFSIVSYTGTGNTTTVGHGLSQRPLIVMIKNRSTVKDWRVGFHAGDFFSNDMVLNDTSASAAYADGRIGDMYAASIEISGTGTYGSVNTSGDNYIAYCWHSVDGFSKIGSYTGNGSTDGPFIYTGFQPKYIMIKRTDNVSGWVIRDDARELYNPSICDISAASSGVEGCGSGNDIDMLSNGFKIRSTNGSVNAGTHIYMAFAEFPFKYTLAR